MATKQPGTLKLFKEEFIGVFYVAYDTVLKDYEVTPSAEFFTLDNYATKSKLLKHPISFNEIAIALHDLLMTYLEENLQEEFPALTSADPMDELADYELSLLAEFLLITRRQPLPQELADYVSQKNWLYTHITGKFPEYVTRPTPNKMYVTWLAYWNFIKCVALFLAKSTVFDKKAVNRGYIRGMFAQLGMRHCNHRTAVKPEPAKPETAKAETAKIES